METVRVRFTYDKKHKEVTAILYGKNGQLIGCYAHLGQHSTCTIGWVNEQKEATEEQYTPLLQELKSLGYNVEVI